MTDGWTRFFSSINTKQIGALRVALRKMGNGNDRASSDGKSQRHEEYGRCAWRKAIVLLFFANKQPSGEVNNLPPPHFRLRSASYDPTSRSFDRRRRTQTFCLRDQASLSATTRQACGGKKFFIVCVLSAHACRGEASREDWSAVKIFTC